jgi:hypothetical protein
MPLTKVASSMLTGGSTGGGGSVGKNYISQYNNGTCNGDFESGNSIGWNLCTVSSISNGLPSGLTVGAGSVATSVISTGQIAGQFSLQTVYPNVANQGIITDVFTIDTEDQAKVMTFKFYYNVTSGASVANFSGTSSNTFIVGIYAVNGSNIGWIQPAGVYSMTQSSGGSGIATGTFQTYSDATQYRFAILCANAPSGSVTMVIDDVYLGPQTAPIGAVMTDWISYTPTWTNLTVGNANQRFFYRRVGDSVEIKGNLQFGSTTSVSGTIVFSLPAGLSIDNSKNPFPSTAGGFSRLGTASIYDTTVKSVLMVIQNGTSLNTFYLVGKDGTTVLDPVNNTSFSWGTGDEIEIVELTVPIAGWSSQVQLSSDTDTRVVAARYAASANRTPTASKAVNFDLRTIDTHSAVTTVSGDVAGWRFTAPVSGIYKVACTSFQSVAVAASLTLFKNGAFYSYMQTVNNVNINSASTLIELVAGDYIDIRSDGTPTLSFITQANTVSIERLSGPSVIAASETVAVWAHKTSGSQTNNGNWQVVSAYTSVSINTHNSFNATTGVFTAPVSGTYQLSGTVAWSANATGFRGGKFTTSSTAYPNGLGSYFTTNNGATGIMIHALSSLIKLNAGETVQIEGYQSSGGSLNYATNNDAATQLSIVRVGN